jgi:hypothetical protein
VLKVKRDSVSQITERKGKEGRRDPPVVAAFFFFEPVFFPLASSCDPASCCDAIGCCSSIGCEFSLSLPDGDLLVNSPWLDNDITTSCSTRDMLSILTGRANGMLA